MGRPPPAGALRGRLTAGRLRVQGGEAGGRRLAGRAGIRPTQGRIKEAIFNSLGGAVLDARVLDLFAGSGALGLEALSRGAARATFVERHPGCVQAIRRNLSQLGYRERAAVVRAEVARWLAGRPRAALEASLLLLDPPYNDPILERVLALLDALADPSATVVVEHAGRHPLPGLQRLAPVRERRYGDTAVSVLRVN